MSKLNCPHCGSQGISVAGKLFLGPALSMDCNVCGKKIGVPFTAVLAIIPFLAALQLSSHIESNTLIIALLAAIIIVTAILYIRCIPLRPR